MRKGFKSCDSVSSGAEVRRKLRGAGNMRRRSSPKEAEEEEFEVEELARV